MKHLLKKLLRGYLKAKGQFVAIVLVIMIGVSMFVGLGVIDGSLKPTMAELYADHNLSDFVASFSVATAEDVAAIAALPSVNRAEGRLKLKASLKDRSADYFVHSIPTDNAISTQKIIEGRLPVAGEVIVDQAHTKAKGIRIGDRLTIVVGDREYALTVSGSFISPEYVYLIENIQSIMPDPKRFGALFVGGDFAQEHSGGYNEVLIDTIGSPDPLEFERQLYALGLAGYGFCTPQADLLSLTMLESDLGQMGNLGIVFSVIFFTVGAIIIMISLSRSIAAERNQIGIMKALGVTDSAIMLHFLLGSLLTVLVGCLFGALLGIFAIPQLMLSAFEIMYMLPPIALRGFAQTTLVSVLLAVAFATLATVFSCRKVFAQKPAQAMRPLPPKKIKPILLERSPKLWSKLSYSNKLILRNIFANKLRAVLSSIGVVASVGLIVASLCLTALFVEIIDVKYAKTNSHDLAAYFGSPMPSDSIFVFAGGGITDITRFSSMQTVFGEDAVKSTLNVINQDGKGITLFDPNDKRLALPTDGIALPKLLADQNRLKIGDKLQLRIILPHGNSAGIEVRISAIYAAYMSQDIFASMEYLRSLGVDVGVSALLISASAPDQLVDQLKSLGAVSIVSVGELLDASRDSMATFYSFISIIIVMSAVLAMTVIYNITAINIAERRRDIATLKVLGYRRGEVDRLIFVENLLITAFGAVIGIGVGAGLLAVLLAISIPESMYIPFALSPWAAALGVLLGFGFTIISNLILRRNTRKIDMVESLKSVE